MKTRVLSSIVGLLLLAVVVVFFDTILLPIAMFFISILATYELLHATNLLKNRFIATIAAIYSIVLPFAKYSQVFLKLPIIIFALLVLFFISLLRYHDSFTFEQLAAGMMVSVFVPLFFSSAVYLRDDFGSVQGGYYLMLALGSAWLSDTGAYFAGYFFGKHKLAPTISPKKTVEGLIGGIITAVLGNMLLAWIFAVINQQNTLPQFTIIILITPFLSLFGVVGDLSASVIKRQHHVKDYGHIMPGHGGIMDRFDSVLLTLPAVYILARLFTFF